MLKRYFSIIFMSICLQIPVFAQDARTVFEQAAAAFDAGNYGQSISYAREAERILGGTNARIQSLKTLAYYESGSLRDAQIELARYFKTSPKAGSSEYEDMIGLRKELERSVAQQYEDAVNSRLVKKEEALAKAASESSAEQEQYFFSVAKQASTAEALRLFLSKYPNGAHVNQANELYGRILSEDHLLEIIEAGDSSILAGDFGTAVEKYNEALLIKRTAGLEEKLVEAKKLNFIDERAKGMVAYYEHNWKSALIHLNIAYSIEPSAEIANILSRVKDELLFQTSTELNTIAAFEEYLKTYASGLHVDDAHAILISAYLAHAVAYLGKGKATEVQSMLAGAKGYSGTTAWTHYTQQYYEVMAKEAARLSKGDRQYRTRNIYQVYRYYRDLDQYSAKDYHSLFRKAKRNRRSWMSPDFILLGVRNNTHGDEWGGDVGYISNARLGAFVSFRLGKNAGHEEGYRNAFDNPRGLTAIPGFLGLNFTYKVLHPVWLYLGGGYTEFAKVNQSLMFEEEGKGYIPASEEGKNGAAGLNIDGGILIRLGPLSLTFGADVPQFSTEKRDFLGLKKNQLFWSGGIAFNLDAN